MQKVSSAKAPAIVDNLRKINTFRPMGGEDIGRMLTESLRLVSARLKNS
jgi:hypothetical protein